MTIQQVAGEMLPPNKPADTHTYSAFFFFNGMGLMRTSVFLVRREDAWPESTVLCDCLTRCIGLSVRCIPADCESGQRAESPNPLRKNALQFGQLSGALVCAAPIRGNPSRARRVELDSKSRRAIGGRGVPGGATVAQLPPTSVLGVSLTSAQHHFILLVVVVMLPVWIQPDRLAQARKPKRSSSSHLTQASKQHFCIALNDLVARVRRCQSRSQAHGRRQRTVFGQSQLAKACALWNPFKWAG